MIVQYIPHADVPAYEAMGWTRSPALVGTNHGHYSALMVAPEGIAGAQIDPLVSEEAMPGVTEP